MFSVLDCIRVRVILFFTHVTHRHTQRDVKPSGAIITLTALEWAKTDTHRHSLTQTHVFPVYLLKRFMQRRRAAGWGIREGDHRGSQIYENRKI